MSSYVVRLSVRPSVTLMYADHKAYKLGFFRTGDIYLQQRNTLKFGVEWRWVILKNRLR